MSDDFALERSAQPEAGSYPCTLEDVSVEMIDGRDGAFQAMRFDLVLELGDGEVYRTDTIAATKDSQGNSAFGNPRMKLTRIVSAFLGSKLPDKLTRDDLIGAQALAQLDLDANGFIKVVGVVARPKGS